MIYTQQSALSIFGGFGGARLAAGRAKPALARKTYGVGRATPSAAISYKAVLFATTAQCLFDRIARGGGNIGWYLALQYRLHNAPMVLENAL
jgi:hypothetical protein